VNYHATNEYESVPNYKVLQQGFTAITLTRVSETAADPEGGQPGAAAAEAAIAVHWGVELYLLLHSTTEFLGPGLHAGQLKIPCSAADTCAAVRILICISLPLAFAVQSCCSTFD
jgi:hypothetical protein